MASQGESFELLCEDLVVDVLSRLPETDLLRCKLVSKMWHRIISDFCVPRLFIKAPVSGVYFRVARLESNLRSVGTCSSLDVKKHVLHLVAHSDAIHYIKSAPFKATPHRYSNNSSDATLSYKHLLPFQHRGPDFLDCCNGLLLFVQRPKPQFYVCNPAIRECVPIPRPSPSLCLPSLYASLAFDPSESIHYRVVILSLASQPQYLHVFYSQTGEWMSHEVQVESPASDQCFRLVRHSVYVKDTLYRLSVLNNILRIDLKTFKVCMINCPTNSIRPAHGCIGLLKGCLSFAKREGDYFRIWLLKTSCDPEQWSLKYEISYEFVLEKLLKLELYAALVWVQPYAFHPKSDIIVLGSSRLLLMYHLENHTLQLLHRNACRDMHGGRFFSIFTYTRTLVTLKNWCSSAAAENNSHDIEVHDDWCYTEQ